MNNFIATGISYCKTNKKSAILKVGNLRSKLKKKKIKQKEFLYQQSNFNDLRLNPNSYAS